MSRNIPLFELFAELSALPELRLRLAGAELTYACIDRAGPSICLDMSVKAPVGQESLQGLEEALKAVYGFEKVELRTICSSPPEPVAASEGSGGVKGEPFFF